MAPVWPAPSAALFAGTQPSRENLEFPRHNDPSNRVYAVDGTIVDACCVAWNKLTAAPKLIRSIGTRD
jgi:hypothetical protein